MTYLPPQDRFQMQMRSMEEFVSKDNPVRFVDAFVELLDYSKVNHALRNRPVLRLFNEMYFSEFVIAA
ncbi:MAG: hypothetical protein EAZ07_05650 [Cytophagales bacterium]|nr:MAG: hypothetical protein EAZ07_05650 [Cytophagales bacterium]